MSDTVHDTVHINTNTTNANANGGPNAETNASISTNGSLSASSNPNADTATPLTSASFVHHLGRTLAEANRFLTDALQEKGLNSLSPSHGDILQELFARGTVSMQELATTINRDPSTVTALVKKLNTLGYTTTRKSERDQRVTEVELTDEGRAIQEKVNGISTALQATQMEGVNEEDVIAAMRVMEQIRRNFLHANETRQEVHQIRKTNDRPTH